MTDLSANFARRILAIEPATLEAADHEQIGRLLFDVSACAYGGMRQPTVAARAKSARVRITKARPAFRRSQPTGRSTLADRAPATTARS